MQRRCNFHTHTYLCKHASGAPADYCEAALKQHVSVLGFSDHSAYPDNRWIGVRMNYDQLPLYVSMVRDAQKTYAGRLDVLLGMEVEYDPECFGYFRDELLGKYHFEYLACAIHHFKINGCWQTTFCKNIDDAMLHAYTDWTVAAIQSGMYDFICHADLFAVAYRGWNAEAIACSRAICQAAKDAHIPLEINAYGLRKPTIMDNGVERHQYPLDAFWEIAAQEGVTAVASSDAHAEADVWGNTDDAVAILRRYGVRMVNEELADRLMQRRAQHS